MGKLTNSRTCGAAAATSFALTDDEEGKCPLKAECYLVEVGLKE